MADSLEHYDCGTIGPHEPFSYRRDPGVPSFPDDRPVIIFDGHCVLCSRWARFVLKHDRRGRYRLLPAQSPLGHALYRHYGLDPVHYETNILLEDGRACADCRRRPATRSTISSRETA